MSYEHLEDRYMSDDKLSFEEFKDYFLDYISVENLSNKFIDNNELFCNSIIFECWHNYLNFYNVDITVFCKLFESFFANLFRYKPVLDNTEYED